MKKPDIFMPLYIGDYLAGTSRLTTEQHGAYLLLIMDYWMNGPLPDDESVLANIAKMSRDAWGMHGALLKQFFSIKNGMLVHKRIEEELSKAVAQKEAAHEKAKKAANARWKNSQNNDGDATSNATSNAQEMLKECPSPSPSPSQLKELPNKPKVSEKQKSTQLTDDFKITDSMRLWFKEKGFNFDADWETDKFKDYFIAKGTRYADWIRTWQNWMRKAHENGTGKIVNFQQKQEKVPSCFQPFPVMERVRK